MSLEASIWAWKAGVKNASQRVVLLSLADRAGEKHRCYPSVRRLVEDTKLNRKTVIKVLDELEDFNLIKDTGEFRGNGVKVYQLIGVSSREDGQNDDSTSTKKGTGTKSGTGCFSGTGSKSGTSTNNGTASSTENGTGTSPKNGTLNPPIESPIESKNIKPWICFKKLREEIYLADADIDFDAIMKSSWAEREKRAFEIYNAEKQMSNDLMIYHFADWLINAYRNKYSDSAKSRGSKFPTAASSKQNHLTEKQIYGFASKLAHHPEFGHYGEPGDSYEKLAAKIAVKLEDPAQAKAWEPYLKQVGFTGELRGAA